MTFHDFGLDKMWPDRKHLEYDAGRKEHPENFETITGFFSAVVGLGLGARGRAKRGASDDVITLSQPW